jgi:hypothetical protein
MSNYKQKQINWKTIMVIVLMVSASYGIWQAGHQLGNWLVNYFDLNHTVVAQSYHLKK